MGGTSPQYHQGSPGDERPGLATPPGRGEPRDDRYALIDQMPGGVVLLDPAGRVVHLNGIAELRLDVVRAEAVGRDLFREVAPQLEVEGYGALYRAAMIAGRAALAFEVSIARSGNPHRIGVGIRSYVQQGTLGAVALLEDRSALAVEEGRRRRAERMAAVGELATGAAHEINNPLASIKGFAQLLARDVGSESQVQALDIISGECTRVARIVDNLLRFAAEQGTRESRSLSLSELVAGVLDLRQYALETSGIEVERDLDESLSPVLGDRGALQRVVLALLGQAERSLGTQGPGKRLIARTRESTDGVVLYLIDNGPGMPRERLRTLFTDSGEDEATFLASAAEAVRDHGGHMWADSIPGQGTAYFVRLPRLEEPAVEKSAASAVPVRSLPGRPLRVLVADDEPSLRLALALFLGRHGHEVVQAADAYEAHRLALAERFDVVLADARMPGDGLALLDKLDAIPHLKGRAILMTGDRNHPFAGGSPDSDRPHLWKPFEMTEVIRLVEAAGR